MTPRLQSVLARGAAVAAAIAASAAWLAALDAPAWWQVRAAVVLPGFAAAIAAAGPRRPRVLAGATLGLGVAWLGWGWTARVPALAWSDALGAALHESLWASAVGIAAVAWFSTPRAHAAAK